jgi:hypothetical protein
VSTGWLLLSLFGPPLAAAVAGLACRGRDPGGFTIIALNAAMPGAGLAAAGRPMIEVVLGVMFAQASLFITGGLANLGFLVPIMVVGGVWGSLHTKFNPLAAPAGTSATRPSQNKPAASPARPVASARPAPTSQPDPEQEIEEAGYSVEVGCTECGAGVPIPVLSRMARCTFCGSDHLVIGHDETLYVTIPEKVRDLHTLREAVLDHYRYQHYLKLYRTAVGPLERNAAEPTASGVIVVRPEATATIAAAEAAVSAKADMYRARLASSLEIEGTQHFLAPYRHGMGTLYQAAFGRSPQDQEKHLQFAVGLVEAAVIATDAMELPEMGRLSYLRALVPAAQSPGELKTLPLERDRSVLEAAYGRLDRKQLVRDLNVIRLGVKFSEEVTAVVWRPWWIAQVKASGIHETLLVDGAAASVAGAAPYLNPEILADLPEEARQPGSGLRFVPMECPTCGHEFPFDADAVVHFCHNCHRVCGIDGERKQELDYLHQPMPEDGDHELVPFWYFPLRLRTGSGTVLTDLLHFKDGIDGTMDQIGDDSVMKQHGILVPAIRCINMKLMARAFARLLLHTLRQPPQLTGKRFPLEEKPQPWPVSLEEPEARNLLPLYLANAFGRRDIARVNVNQVADWLFEAVQEKPGTLVFVPVPRPVTEPFRPYIGRYRSQAVRHARQETH